MDNSRLSNSGYTTSIGTKAGPDGFADAFKNEYAYNLPLKAFFRVLWQRLWVIVLVALTFAGVAVGVSLTLTPKYEATTTILIGQAQGSAIPTAGSLQGEAQGLQQITQTMTEIVRSRTVAETAIQQLGLQTTAGAVKANLNSEQVRATQIIRVSYRDTDPERAQQVANAVGDVFSEQISELSPSANAVTATVLDRAQLPQEPVTPDTQRNGLLALGIGVMLGIALVLLLEYLNDSWRSPEEAEQISGVPVYGIIPEFEVVDSKSGSN